MPRSITRPGEIGNRPQTACCEAYIFSIPAETAAEDQSAAHTRFLHAGKRGVFEPREPTQSLPGCQPIRQKTQRPETGPAWKGSRS